jgi:class 3 adenylate cyclase
MSIEMREEISGRIEKWKSMGHELGFGVGIACGHATLGCVGFEGRFQYSATGTVVNLASRLCDQALHGQILVDLRVHTAVQSLAETEPAGELSLKGLHRPVKAFNVIRTSDIAHDAAVASQDAA